MKHRLLILLVTTLGLLNSASAQTNVSGFINANTNWTMAGSPYIVTGNALLSQGFTLTIDPGVVVKFGTNNALQIDGQLIAIGTPTQHITFTSNQPNPQPGDWAKLHFSDFSTDAVYNAQGNYVSGSIIKYCDVLYGGSLMWGSIDIQQCSPYINHCRIMNGSWCGINFNGDHLTVDTSRISDMPKRGIYFQGGDFLLRNDTFISNLEGAINFMQSGGMAQSRILDSYFRLNYGALCWQSNSPAHVTIMNSTFALNNGPYVVSLRGEGDTISCNKFRYNSNGPAIEMDNQCSTAVIHNNLIEYNTNSNGPSVFNLSLGGCDSMFICNNTITHNSSPGNSCCFISSPVSSPIRPLQIYNNVFTENDGANFMTLWSPQTNDPSINFIHMYNNNFINPLCTYELNNAVPYGSPNLFVDNNYWGSSNTSFVDGRIYDYFDFANQSVVYYNPVLTAPVAVDTACQPFQLPVGIREENSLVGGFLLYPNPTDGNITITFSDPSQFDGGLIEILNPLGEVVFSEQLLNATSKSMPLPEASGVYLVRVVTEEGIRVDKVVKE